jgi:Streptomyces sporulation and cell division protein, SsgA
MIETRIDGAIWNCNGQQCNTPLIANLLYDENEPLVVHFLFEWMDDEGYDWEVCWEIGRDLIVKALTDGAAGSGDVILVDLGQNSFSMSLIGEEGTCALTLNHSTLRVFINQTTKVVPLGSEDVSKEMDEFLASLLG